MNGTSGTCWAARTTTMRALPTSSKQLLRWELGVETFTFMHYLLPWRDQFTYTLHSAQEMESITILVKEVLDLPPCSWSRQSIHGSTSYMQGQDKGSAKWQHLWWASSQQPPDSSLPSYWIMVTIWGLLPQQTSSAMATQGCGPIILGIKVTASKPDLLEASLSPLWMTHRLITTNDIRHTAIMLDHWETSIRAEPDRFRCCY